MQKLNKTVFVDRKLKKKKSAKGKKNVLYRAELGQKSEPSQAEHRFIKHPSRSELSPALEKNRARLELSSDHYSLRELHAMPAHQRRNTNKTTCKDFITILHCSGLFCYAKLKLFGATIQDTEFC